MRTRVVTHRLTLPGAPAGLRIALLADFHACRPWMPVARIEGIVAEANGLGADLIAVLGDYAGHILLAPQEPPGAVAAALARLRAPLGVFAVLGNHDWRRGQREGATTVWHRALREAGVTTLVNAATRIEAGGAPLQLAGIDSQRAFRARGVRRGPPTGAHDLEAALAGLAPGVPTILLAHEPDIFPETPDPVRLVLSGHTHGGQIRLLGRPWVVPSRYGTRYAWGHHREDGRDLVVSGGLGCTTLPLRIGVPPEITVVELA